MASKKKGGPKLPNIQTLLQAGINPKTGLPYKFDDGDLENLDNSILKVLRIIDEQDAVNRYVWSGIPCDLSSQEIERMLYYYGQLMFFYNKNTDKFMITPYALTGTIDFYGRYNVVKPVPISNGTTEEDKKNFKNQLDLLTKLELKVVKSVFVDDLTLDVVNNSCVLIHDYSKQLSQVIIPRQQLNDPILKVMAECIPFMRTSLIAGSGIKGMRVNDADQKDSVEQANQSLVACAKTGKVYIPVTGAIDIQEFTDGQPIKAEEYMITMQSLDNFRRSTYGITNGGLFEKKAHELEEENALNAKSAMNQLQDGLAQRQNFCNIINSIWGIGIWCEPSENVILDDLNGDGVGYDENTDSNNSGVSSSSDEGGEE